MANTHTSDTRYEFDLNSPDVFKSAVFSQCGAYRYELRRTWDEAEAKLVVIGLNPSTADAKKDDPTIRKCVGFARRWGCGGIIMLNLFAWRATDPKKLTVASRTQHPSFVIGPDNDDYLRRVPATVGTNILCAWGAHGGTLGRGGRVLSMLRERPEQWARTKHLGLTKDGHPKHPLYLPYTTVPQEWTQ